MAANVMFLKSVSSAAQGAEPATLVCCRELEPDTVGLRDSLPPGLPMATDFESWLAELWPAIGDAATVRRHRVGN
ncbi:hypothetical protein [Streptomyces gardneri]|uniref:hypothetical protein n=1 Tax=Streptomyces gardneri TaxID=66892 RepID=UPI0035DF3E15